MPDNVLTFVESRAGLGGKFKAHYEDAEVWSSFDRIEHALAAEEEFGIQFTPEELTDLGSPKSFVDAIQAKLNEN